MSRAVCRRPTGMSTDYTHTNLAGVEDAAPAMGIAGPQEIRFARDALEARDTGLTHHRLRPGCRQAIGHRHDHAEEVYVVLSCSGRGKLGDDIIEISALDAIRVAPPVMRSFEAGPDGLELLAIGPHHAGDGEVVPGWWSD
jgi:mannose-6-phosphate isomerase-like protein (cupin superfamily)